MISLAACRIVSVLVFFIITLSAEFVAAKVLHEVFLANTEHELHVYRVLGKEPGNTMMLIGGIQGDEPGGYLTADLYADITLLKGNLIVVPRANFYSILLNQRNGQTGDMNRKFDGGGEPINNMEEEIVAILKHLTAESDCLLNLHEGAGYYAPQWVSDAENPMRFGQSIIYDTDTYNVPGERRTIYLSDLVQKVIDKVNRQIGTPRYHFKSNNHNTLAEDSPHKEQRKSATYYALTKAHIPAIGVETSKLIESLETKIRLQKLVVNTFMEEFGIILEAPGVSIEKPMLSYVLVKVNGGLPLAVTNGVRLEVAADDELMVTDVITNYERGITADVEGIGSRNDLKTSFRIARPTRVLVRKDAETCGWIELGLKATTPAIAGKSIPVTPEKTILEAQTKELRAEKILVNVDGGIKAIHEGQTLKVPKKSRLVLEGIRSNIVSLDSEILVNFKGFTPPKAVNNGNDLHFPISTSKDILTRFSENKRGNRYQIEATYQGNNVGRFWIELR